MGSSYGRIRLLVSLFALALTPAGAKAQSGFTFTLTQPDISVVRPSSGTIQVVLSGTITFTGGDKANQISLNFPFQSAGVKLTGNNDTNFINAAFSGTNYTGPVAELNLPSSAILGLYNKDSGLVNPSLFSVQDNSTTIARPFSVNVISSSVPEPGSVALLVGMCLSGAGFLARRRKNACKAA